MGLPIRTSLTIGIPRPLARHGLGWIPEVAPVTPTAHCRDFQDLDFPAVQALWLATGLGAPERGDDLAQIRRTLAQGGRLLVLEEPGGALAGTAWLTQDGRRSYLHHFGIRPDLQGRGLGRQLMAAVLEVARPLGLQLKLEVGHANARAQDLYRRHGFQPVGDYDVLIIRKF
jgi:ribosomal protein S18 acetylase RimI-like enzyme